jgi:hypothetical protein
MMEWSTFASSFFCLLAIPAAVALRSSSSSSDEYCQQYQDITIDIDICTIFAEKILY